MMRLKMTSNFSWVKLYKYVTQGKEFGSFVGDLVGKPIVEDSKRMIRENQIKPKTSDKTIKKRLARKSPKAISSSTLHDTGALHDSIRMTDSGGGDYRFLKGLKSIEFMEYGLFHQFGAGGHKKREFIKLSPENNEEISRKIMSRFVRSFKKRLSR